MNNQIKKLLPLAVTQALKSPMLHRHGAVIWKRNQVLGAGYNHSNTFSDSARRHSVHSEKDAMKGLHESQLRGASVLAIRLNKSDEIVSGAPCKGCSKLMKRKGISKCYWYDTNNNLNCTYY